MKCKFEIWDKTTKQYICSNILTECGAECKPCEICCLYEKDLKDYGKNENGI